MDSSADKEGLQSSGRKEQSSRHGVEPSPGAAPVPGAYGREDIAREADGKPVVPSRLEDEVAEDLDLELDDEAVDDEGDDDLDFEEDAGDDEPAET
jgi:hypothetical protein